jgi:peptide/nickel transport system substrate-binding protein/oligopeptide transport system substrate-binding protein
VKKKLWVYAVLCWALAAAVPAFGQDKGAAGEIVVAFSSTEISLNPLNSFASTEAQIFTALYEGLVGYNPSTLQPVSGAARSWDISADGKTYTFTIREDARYWNGDPVTAADFKAAWLKFLDPSVKAEYSFLYDIIEGAKDYRTGVKPDPSSVGIKVLAPKKLQVTLEEPATHFLRILCHHSFSPIHPAMLDKKDWNALPQILGNGPFRIEERGKDFIRLVKNAQYWDARNVKAEALRLIFTDNADETTRRFNGYEIHWAAANVNLNKVLYKDTIIVNPLFATSYFYFTNAGPWNNNKLRRALALLVPWEEVRSTAFQFLPAKTLVPPIPNYPAPETIAANNKEEALKLLEESGFPQGKGLPQVVFKIPEGVEHRRLAALMAAAWKEQGIESELKTYPFAQYFESLKDSDYTLGIMTWIADFADPLAFLQMWTSGSNLNEGRYSDSLYDGLIKKSMSQTGEERYKTLSEAESVLLRTAQVLPLGHNPAVNLIDLQYIDGWYQNLLDIHPFKYISLAPYKPLKGVVKR